MNKVVTTLVLIFCVGCAPIKYMYGVSQLYDYNSGETKKHHKMMLKAHPLFYILEGRNIDNVLEDSDVKQGPIIKLPKWDNPKKKIPYKVAYVNFKDADFVFYYTFDDFEDGGNTFGWVDDTQGKKVCVIADGYFEFRY